MSKPICLDLSYCSALGDTICSTPTLRKVSESYQKKITVITKYPEIFKNNPYVDKIYSPSSVNIEYIKDNFIYHNSFHSVGKQNEDGVEFKHNNMDIRQFHATKLGFMLSEYEMDCEYYPENFEPIDNLPGRFVLIHPVQTWPSRTWESSKWMELTRRLNSLGIPVISIGKDSSEVGFFNVEKPIFNFEIEKGLNLMNKTTISQAWHLINKSICFVTMDSGLLHLSGTTDANIIMLGSSIKPEFRLPYRKGTQSYKQEYVSGGCRLNCASDMKYGVKEWGSIQNVPPLISCLENKKTFECHPSVDLVVEKINYFL
jgi:ADP-heptose:LPS heptosyltransferase